MKGNAKRVLAAVLCAGIVSTLFLDGMETVAVETEINRNENVNFIFEEDFDGYNTTVWFDNVSDEKVNNLTSAGGTNYKVGADISGMDSDGLWTINKQADAKGILSVIDAPEGGTGKVLRYSNWGSGVDPLSAGSADSGSSTSFLTVRRNAVDGGEIGFANDGKITVLESKVYVPDAIIGYDTAQIGYSGQKTFANFTDATAYTAFQNGGLAVGSGFYYAQFLPEKFEAYSSNIYSFGETNHFMKGQWHNYKLVIDRTSGSQKGPDCLDTFRVYVDDKLIESYYKYGEAVENEDGTFTYTSPGKAVQGAVTYDMPRRQYRENAIGKNPIVCGDSAGTTVSGNELYSMGDFFGIMFGTRGAAEMYIDSMKAYTVERKFEVAEVLGADNFFETSNNDVTVTFTTPVSSGKEAYIYLADENGTEIKDAITERRVSEDGYCIVLTMNRAMLSDSKVYYLMASAHCTDVYGQGLVTWYGKYKHELFYPNLPAGPEAKLCEISNLAVDPEASSIHFDSASLGEAKQVQFDMVLTKGYAKSMIGAAVLYDENKMLTGIALTTIEAGEKQASITIPVRRDGAKTFRLFLYESAQSGGWGKLLREPYVWIEQEEAVVE